MITELTTPFIEAKDEFVEWLKVQECPSYEDLLAKALELAVANEDDFEYGEAPDPERIHRINDGDYQGTLVFLIGAKGYQPSTYWATGVSYGSCSGCDSLQAASDYGEESDFEALYTIALHMMQSLGLVFV